MHDDCSSVRSFQSRAQTSGKRKAASRTEMLPDARKAPKMRQEDIDLQAALADVRRLQARQDLEVAIDAWCDKTGMTLSVSIVLCVSLKP